jgi:hypothetical protein
LYIYIIKSTNQPINQSTNKISEDKKMKTSFNHNRASKMATVLCAAIAFGTSAWAQSDAGSNTSSTVEAFDRLEVLMTRTEESVKYLAPCSGDAEADEARERLELLANDTEKAIRYQAPASVSDELNEAVERLEMLASHIENEIRYSVNPDEQTYADENGVPETNQTKEIGNALTLYTAYFSNK